MQNLVYVYYILLIAILAFGIKIYGKKQWNPSFLTLKQTKALQGFSVCCIMLHHIAQKTCAPWVPSEYVVPGLEPFLDIGYLLVSIFFFCSGYGLYKSNKEKDCYLKTFLGKRLLLIIIALFITNMIYIYIQMWQGVNFAIIPIPFTIGGAILPNKYSWYIYTMILFYIAFYFSFRYCKSERNAMIWIFVVTIIYIAHCDWWMFGDWWYNTVILFGIGLLFAKYENRIISIMKKRYISFIIVGLLFTSIFFVLGIHTQDILNTWNQDYHYAFMRWTHVISQMIASIAFLWTLLLIMMKVNIGNRFLNAMGTITLEFYLIHGLFVECFSYCFVEKGNNSIFYLQNVALMVLVVFVLSLISGVVLHIIHKMIVQFLHTHKAFPLMLLRDAKRVTIFFLILLLAITIKFTITNRNITKSMETAVEQYKKDHITFVDVDGKQMSAYVTGEGEHTIVFFGSPSDFCPTMNVKKLADLLGESHKVIVFDHFGTGFSDDTDKPRTLEQHVWEMHEAVQAIGVTQPYILMAHKDCGLYQQLYTQEYQDEVEAVICLDTTVGDLLLERMKDNQVTPQQYNRTMKKKALLSHAGQKIVVSTGYGRLQWKIFEKIGEYLDDKDKLVLEEVFLKRYKSKNMLDEMLYEYENCSKMEGFKFDESVNVQVFLAYATTYSVSQEELDWTKLHEQTFSNVECQKYNVLTSNSSIVYYKPYLLKKRINLYIEEIQ